MLALFQNERKKSTLHESSPPQSQYPEESVRAAVLDEPNVRAVMEAFPEAGLDSYGPAQQPR